MKNLGTAKRFDRLDAPVHTSFIPAEKYQRRNRPGVKVPWYDYPLSVALIWAAVWAIGLTGIVCTGIVTYRLFN